ncbi:TadE/TadG family type IV pilus assembly protein [Pseudovibrio denitrificans]|uniref:Pilus assembly protein n=1 Tax=Pseudovibrio brasiliensis TaxID=1898042 RepID=A0ABX8AMZ9_9HYPH|nr:TadE/TadG family type IV pilus assembly protein [Pseudovibrio brasiliensis]QUS56459.1 pilus assembly protein [Pseudovibrio brasiliensis]
MGLKFKKSEFFKAFWRQMDGVAAIEFAIVLPLLLFLFIGMVELTTAISYDRRVSKAGAAIGDLVARSDDITGDTADLRTAIEHQMAPFDDADIAVRVGMVLIRSNEPQTVWSWDSATNGEPWPQGSVPDGVTFSDSMLVNGQYYLVSTSQLEYNFILGGLLSNLYDLLASSGDDEDRKFTSISLNDSFILLPRRVSCVEFDDNCASWPP